VPEKTKAFLSLREAFDFFKAAAKSAIGARLAVEGFAGLRVSSSARMEEHEVRIEEGGIELPAGKHKLERRFFVQGFPENLFTWLELPNQRWDISESTYDHWKIRVFDQSGVKNPGNVLRHSFCTYHIAAYGDASKTATLLTHRGPAMLYRHYLGRGVSRKEALLYFAITPKSVEGTFEQFLASSATHEQHSNRSHRQRNLPTRDRAGQAPEGESHLEPDNNGSSSTEEGTGIPTEAQSA
jgi:integrase